MALTATEKMHCKQILGLPEVAPYTWVGDDPDTLLSGVASHVEDEIRDSILPAWEEVKNDTDEIEAEGLTSVPSKARARLRSRLAGLIGFGGLRGVNRRPRRLR